MFNLSLKTPSSHHRKFSHAVSVSKINSIHHIKTPNTTHSALKPVKMFLVQAEKYLHQKG